MPRHDLWYYVVCCKDETKMPCRYSFALEIFSRREGRIIVCLFLTKLIFCKPPISLPINDCATDAASSASACASWSVIIVFPHGLTEALVCEAGVQVQIRWHLSLFSSTCSEYLQSLKKRNT